MADIIVTGLPRAGSTMVSALVDYLPGALCLNTPPWQHAYAKKPLDILPFCKWLVGDFAWHRRLILDGQPISDVRAADGTPFLDGADPRIMRNDEGEPLGVHFVRPGLSGDFLLAMRQNTLFTSILPTLVKFRHFTIFAVIRHPLDVLTAWQSLPQPLLAQGNPPGIARYWPEALAVIESAGSEADRFAQLYDLYIQRYHELREHVQILRYEDVRDEPMLVSNLLGADKISAAARLIEKRTRVHSRQNVENFRAALRKYGLFTKLYYPDI